MTKRSAYRLGNPAQFAIGESIPLKGAWLKVAHIEEGVLILTLDNFTKAGVAALAKLKVELLLEQRDELKEISSDMLPTRNEK